MLPPTRQALSYTQSLFSPIHPSPLLSLPLFALAFWYLECCLLTTVVVQNQPHPSRRRCGCLRASVPIVYAFVCQSIDSRVMPDMTAHHSNDHKLLHRELTIQLSS